MPETPEMNKTATQDRRMRHALILLSIMGCYSYPVALYLSVLISASYSLLVILFLLISMLSPIVVIVLLVKEFMLKRSLRPIAILAFTLIPYLGLATYSRHIFPLTYGTAIRTRMMESLDMDSLQSDALKAIHNYSDELAIEGRVSLSGSRETESPPKQMETEYRIFKPNHVSISTQYGNEPCVFFNYGGGFQEDMGIIVGSPTFILDSFYAWKWKWADGIYFYDDWSMYGPRD